MDVLLVKQYLETRGERDKMESQFTKLGKQLTKVREDEEVLSGKVDSDSLITAKSVKTINELLSNRPLWLNNFPVSFAQLTLKNGNLHLSVIFSQPLFRGWRTKIPYISYKMCSLSLETPVLPDENHIPEYLQVSDYDYTVICWEREGTTIKLWSDEKRGIEFRW